jgi:hypothetical protein
MADHAVVEDDIIFIYTGGRAPQHITHARIDKSVTVIEEEAFCGNPHLLSVDIHDKVERVKHMAFCNCTSLSSVKLLGVKVIEEGAFYNCTQLTDVEFGNKLEIIRHTVFASCTSLENVTIPSVKNVGEWAFNGCTRLTSLDLPEELETVQYQAFDNCPSLRRLVIPLNDGTHDGITIDNDNVFDCPNLTRVALVGWVHSFISSSPLEHWRKEIIDEIRQINQVLPNTPTREKTAAIQQWMRLVIRKINKYKSEHYSYKILKEATALLERALFIENKEVRLRR